MLSLERNQMAESMEWDEQAVDPPTFPYYRLRRHSIAEYPL